MLPIANINVSDNFQGVFKIRLVGVYADHFVVQGTVLYLTKPFEDAGLYGITVVLEDPSKRFETLSADYFVKVGKCPDGVLFTTTTTTTSTTPAPSNVTSFLTPPVLNNVFLQFTVGDLSYVYLDFTPDPSYAELEADGHNSRWSEDQIESGRNGGIVYLVYIIY